MRIKELMVGATIAGLTMAGCGGSEREPDIQVGVDCGEAPETAVIANFSDLDNGEIRVRDGEDEITIRVAMGNVAVEGQTYRAYEKGEVVAELPGALVLAGATEATLDQDFEPDQAVSLFCKGVQGVDLMRVVTCSAKLPEETGGPVMPAEHCA